MNEDAFARRFYADRSELEALGIQLSVDKPVEGIAEQENYSLPPENFYLPAIEFTDAELAALQTALSPARRRVRLRRAAAAGAPADLVGSPEPAAGARASARSRSASPPRPAATTSRSAWRRSRRRSSAARRSPSTTTRWSATRSARARSTPTSCCSRAASSTSSATRTSATRSASSGSRASAARSPTRRRPSTTSSAPSRRSTRARTPNRVPVAVRRRRSATPRCASRERIAWQIERHFGRYGEMRAGDEGRDACSSPRTPTPRQLVVVGARARRARARCVGPPELVDELAERSSCSCERHARRARAGASSPRAARRGGAARRRTSRPTTATAARGAAIRPERFARLVTLASILIEAGRAGRRVCRPPRCCERLQISDAGAARGHQRAQRRQLRRRLLRPLRRGRSARRDDRGRPRAPTRDYFARPARLLPVEAKALVAAIDLIGEHIPEGSLASAREKIVAALGEDPIERGPAGRDARRRRLAGRARSSRARSPAGGCSRSSTTRRTRTSSPSARVEPYALINGREGWYVASFDPDEGRRAPLPPRPHQARDRRPTSASSRGPRSTRRPTSTAGRAPARSRPRGARACGSRPSARAGRARSARWSSRARRRRDRRRARASRASTGSCARCSRRPATPPCSSPPTRARPSRRAAERLPAAARSPGRAPRAASRAPLAGA